MRRTQKIIGLFIAVFLFAVSIHVLRASGQAGAGTSPYDASKDQARQALLIVREINTAEVSCGMKEENIEYLPWGALLNAPCFSRFQSHFSDYSGFPLSPGPEIVPGLELRLLISPDGKHYSLWLGQKLGGDCAFAFYSDERGVIYEGASLGCDSPGVR